MVLISISLMANDAGLTFMCFFAIYTSFSVKCLFVSFAYVLTGLSSFSAIEF